MATPVLVIWGDILPPYGRMRVEIHRRTHAAWRFEEAKIMKAAGAKCTVLPDEADITPILLCSE